MLRPDYRKFSGVEQSSGRPPTTASVHHDIPRRALLHPSHHRLSLGQALERPGAAGGEEEEDREIFHTRQPPGCPFTLYQVIAHHTVVSFLYLSLLDDRLRDYFGFLFTINLFSIMLDHLTSRLLIKLSSIPM